MQNPVSHGAGHARPTATVEDYLALLFVLERDGQPAHASRMAELIGVALPTASATIKRMVRDGWVSVKDHEVQLTADGRKKARSVTRRHFIIEALLRDLLGVPWSRLHSEAHALEHAISDETLARAQEKLHNPSTCPHGNPMPGEEKAVANWVRLGELAPGDSGVIKRIHEFAEDNGELMAFLESNGLMPGTRFTVRDVLPFNQTMLVDTGAASVALGLHTAQWIYAEPLHTAPHH
ncbi:MAG: metal-dependent transcriptional regulator [Chloroflexi bacterium]|nr:metal-dependent transcriptional regulator [Chloroflexota bacterium]